jgi:hypothetical protein
MDGLMSGSSSQMACKGDRFARNALKMKENVEIHPAWRSCEPSADRRKMAHDFPECRGQADAAVVETPVNAGLGGNAMVLGLPDRGE